MPHLLITGYKGSGKSTVGRLLAERMGREFRDLDSVLEEVYAQETGERLGFREIYRKLGQARFRVLELRAARQLRREAAEHPEGLVIALGGGSLMTGEARLVLQGIGRVIYLRVPIDSIVERMERSGWPAFIKGDDPEAEFRALFEQREPVYRQVAQYHVDIGHANPRQAVDRVLEAIGWED